MKPTPLAAAPPDAQARRIRASRAALFDDIAAKSGAQPPPTPLPLVDQRLPPPYLTFMLPPMPELPFAFSDTILVGKIDATQAYLSNDEGSIYTESTVGVERVLSQQGSYARAGRAVAIDQPGGSILLPDNRVIRIVPTGLGTPFQSGDRCVFFLVYRPAAQAFKLMKAWKLADGVAQPMWPADVADAENGRSAYAGMPEANFIAAAAASRASRPPGN